MQSVGVEMWWSPGFSRSESTASNPRRTGALPSAFPCSCRRSLLGQPILREDQANRARHGQDFVTALVSDQEMRGPGLHAIVLSEPFDHVACGHFETIVESADELRL